MDPVSLALIVGFLGVCVCWTVSKRLSEKLRGQADDTGDNEQEATADYDPKEAGAVYKRMAVLRLYSVGLCVLAIAALYFQLHLIVPLALAAGACWLQWHCFRIRSAYLRKTRFIPKAK